MAKINKKRTEDVFAGLKFVDNMLNEAAGIKKQPALSLEERLKKRLLENMTPEMDETSSADISVESAPTAEATNEDTTALLPEEQAAMDEYNYGTGDNYNYNYDGKQTQYENSEEESVMYEDPDLLEMLLEDDDEQPAVADPTADAGVDPSIDPTAAPADGAMPGAPEMGAEPGMDATAGADLGVDAGMEPGAEPAGDMGAGAAPSMGGATPDLGGAPAGGEEPAAVSAQVDVTASPEDIDAMIDSLLGDVSLMENAELADLGYEDLGDVDIDGKKLAAANAGIKANIETSTPPSAEETVKDAMQEAGVVKENETPKSTPLGDDDITGKVQGGGENKNGEAEKGSKSIDFKDAGVDTITGATPKSAEKRPTISQPEFDKVKKESALKDKALLNLGAKYVALEEQNKKLKFEHFKAQKVNAILTLLPELKQATRETLVKRFDEAKDYATVRKLYADVTKMVKESKRPSLNEAVSKATKGVKTVITENTTEEAGEENSHQSRIDFLMGIKGAKNEYFNY